MIKRFFNLIGKAIFWCILLSVFWVILYTFIPVYVTPLMVIRYVQDEKHTSWQHDWEPIENISSNLQLAVICSEDQKFLYHNGFDIDAIEKAYEKNKKGKKLKGASGISQQTAKNVFLWPNRSWLRKGLEVYFTFLIEVIWGKERILEVYLNSIEMGHAIYGAEAASKHWFGVNASKLTRDQAATLAAILPNPLRYRANPASPYVQRQKNWIVRQMSFYGPFSLDAVPTSKKMKSKK